jgi:chromosomal replication initiator protein
MAHSTIYNKEIDLELTERIIRKMVRKETKSVTIDSIIDTVCKHFELDPAAIYTKSRKREVVQVRQVAMYLAKKHTDSSSSKIGQLIGNKDHATVLHACKIVKDQCEVDKNFRADLENIELSLKTR